MWRHCAHSPRPPSRQLLGVLAPTCDQGPVFLCCPIHPLSTTHQRALLTEQLVVRVLAVGAAPRVLLAAGPLGRLCRRRLGLRLRVVRLEVELGRAALLLLLLLLEREVELEVGLERVLAARPRRGGLRRRLLVLVLWFV